MAMPEADELKRPAVLARELARQVVHIGAVVFKGCRHATGTGARVDDLQHLPTLLVEVPKQDAARFEGMVLKGFGANGGDGPSAEEHLQRRGGMSVLHRFAQMR
jgi:hypothetical protein